MNNQGTTQEHNNALIEFCQALCEQGFRQQRDALSETLAARLLARPVDSCAVLSLAPCFKRQWHSLAEALEGGEVDEAWLQSRPARRVPRYR